MLGTKAWGNKTKEMYHSLLSLKLKMTFFVLYHQSLQPNMNFNISKLIYSPPYLVPEEIFSNLNSLPKNTVLRNRFCSITTCLFHSETTKYWFIVWKYAFLLHTLNKNENVINAGYWVPSENRKNLFPARKTNLS